MKSKEYTKREIKRLIGNDDYIEQIIEYIGYSQMIIISERKKNTIIYCFQNNISPLDCSVKIMQDFYSQFY